MPDYESPAKTGAHIRSIAARCLAAALGLLTPALAGSVIILDSSWEAAGGRKGQEWRGFGAHEALAAQPQFSGVLSFSSDGETWGEASGTWLGNDENHAYILTAAHIYEEDAEPDEYAVQDQYGNTHYPDRVWIHPRWNNDIDLREGYDLAILRLPAPLKNMGEAPLLYTGTGELGQLITFVGYGSRGIGSEGEDERFFKHPTKAAAQGLVEAWADLIPKPQKNESAGNYLGVLLPREDGGIKNSLGDTTRPRTPLVGLLGSGDSGGSAWMQDEGQWVLVAVNSNGVGDAGYGETSWFARVAPHQQWIQSIFPGARFAETNIKHDSGSGRRLIRRSRGGSDQLEATPPMPDPESLFRPVGNTTVQAR